MFFIYHFEKGQILTEEQYLNDTGTFTITGPYYLEIVTYQRFWLQVPASIYVFKKKFKIWVFYSFGR